MVNDNENLIQNNIIIIYEIKWDNFNAIDSTYSIIKIIDNILSTKLYKNS